jgi:phenylacetic acid degradation operon negative regulatory protein
MERRQLFRPVPFSGARPSRASPAGPAAPMPARGSCLPFQVDPFSMPDLAQSALSSSILPFRQNGLAKLSGQMVRKNALALNPHVCDKILDRVSYRTLGKGGGGMKNTGKVPIAVWRRRIGAELVDMLAVLGYGLARPMSLVWLHGQDSQTAMRYAAYRLQKAGLITMRHPRGRPPDMILTETGRSRVSELIWPERWWRKKWRGTWFVLVYDVPEKQAAYRQALRGFLRRMRLGYLQRSVWITPWDIRPAFDDLRQAAAVTDYAVLLQAQSTLDQSDRDLARQAWNFERLDELHSRYLAGMQRPSQTRAASRGILAEMRSALHEYCRVMAEDPLLPEALYPSGYQGPAVVRAFRRRLRNLVGL